MCQLGVSDRCEYPGFSEESMHAFTGLAHDLSFADDFLGGNGDALKAAAAKEEAELLQREKLVLAEYSGDNFARERLRACFHARDYVEVLRLAEDLKFPEFLPESERNMIAISKKRSTSN